TQISSRDAPTLAVSRGETLMLGIVARGGRRRIGRWHRSQPIVPDERGVVMPRVRDVGDADLES
ncbi:MAG: hypothetical protein WAO16_31945, partial [Pseudolabrys sp.]